MGASGSGKTTSLSTLADTGLNVRVLFTENGLESFKGAWADYDKPIPKNIAWTYVKNQAAGFDDLLKNAENVAKFNLDSLAKLSDPKRNDSNSYFAILSALNKFTDERTGANLGCADEWDNQTILAIDGLTELNASVMHAVAGNKPVRSMSDWGIAQQTLENTLRKLTNGMQCHVILLAHIERETDPVSSVSRIMVSVPGKALAPKLPAMFSDVILSVREGTNYYWDTASPGVDVKSRNLPPSAKHPQNFGPLFSSWTRRAIA